ncbi:MAG TPA: M2 family metallopeptidase [Gemmataceae bacterium]|nr:M2 family metallopeptidase [Gemmataceae bacterium]
MMFDRFWRRLVLGPTFVSVFLGITMINSATKTGAAEAAAATGNELAKKFITYHERDVRPLDIAVGKAWWTANTTGRDEDFAAKVEAQNKLDHALASADRFAELKAAKAAQIADPLLRRQIDILYLIYLEKQVDPGLLQRITAKSNDIEKAFNVFRAKVGERQLVDSEVRKVLKESKDSAERQRVWEASKQVGRAVEADLRQLVLLRNEAAKKLGFKDYHAMQLTLNEQSQDEVLKLFDKLDDLTRGPFAAAKQEIDASLSLNYGIDVDELRPWHYHDPFFQESPAIFTVSLDSPFASADILKLCRTFYAAIGLPIDDVIERSDLYEKPGKSPHAFCTDIDREGDVRVLANIVPNEYWMGTMLHELGHSVYSSKNIPESVPYVLRTDAHILCTEGVAMMFERFSKNGDWLVKMGVGMPDPAKYTETGMKMRRNQLLIFSRWCQVMLRFEKSMYADPQQDLNKLWWDLVEKYQLLKRPSGRNEPDFASKIHVVSAPAYYHNYMMGQLFACQVHSAICRDVLKTDNPARAFYTDNKQVGEFMRTRVFAPGRSLPWNELTKHATGEELNPNAFAAEFGGK